MLRLGNVMQEQHGKVTQMRNLYFIDLNRYIGDRFIYKQNNVSKNNLSLLGSTDLSLFFRD